MKKMAEEAASNVGTSAVETDSLLESFYSEVADVEAEKRFANAYGNSKDQIDRLLRPGSTYFNLNPFEVLQVDPNLPIEDVRKQYRQLSRLVHPDKNPDDLERAKAAFDVIKKAYQTLDDEVLRRKCLEVIEEAKGRTDQMIQEKKKKLKKEGKDGKIEEDDPEKYKHAIYVMSMKLFADLERKRRKLEDRDQEERKRKREDEIAEEEKKKTEKEWQKNFEESRQGRVASWQTFQDKKKAKKSNKAAFKPPKHKAESR